MKVRPCHYEWHADDTLHGGLGHGCTRSNREHKTHHRCGCGAQQEKPATPVYRRWFGPETT